MPDPVPSLISDPFAPAPGPRPFESGTLTRPASSSLISDLGAPDRLQDAARRAPTQSPDQVARIFTLQRKTGLPKDLIERNLDDVERQAAAADFNPETFRATSPLLASWLASDAGHLALAQDDLQPLSTMERLLGVGRNVAGAPVAGLLKQVSRGFWGAVAAGAEAVAPPAAQGNIDLYAQPKVRNADGSISTVDSVSVNFDGQEVLLSRVTPDGRHLTTEEAIAEYEKTGRHLGMFQTPEAATAYAAQLHEDYAAGKYDQRPVSAQLASFARGSAAVADVLATRARGKQTEAGFVESAVYSGLESLGGNVPGLILGILTGPGAMLAVAGVTTAGESYATAREQGLGVGKAVTHGTIQGVVEVATEFIPAHRLLGDLAAHSGLVKTLAHQLVPEVLGEEVATAVQDLNEWALLPANKDRTVGDYLRERPSAAAATAISTIVAMGGTTVIAHTTAHLLERFGEAAQDSKTLKRSPEKAEEWIAHATKDGPVETVHLPIAPAVEYWQSKGLDPATVATQLTGDPDAYRQALTTGEDLVVPFARYATQIAATEHNTFFTQEARFDPLAMNVREEQALSSQLSAQASAAPAEPSVATAGEQIRTELVDRFVAGGQMERSTAETNATVVQAFFDTFVQGRAGLDALALFTKRVGTVQRGTAPAEVTATFLAHSPGGPLYNLVGGAQHGSTVSAESLRAQGIDIPDTPADTGERLSGEQLRARALAVAAQAGPLGQEDLAALLAEPQTIRRLDRRRTQTDQPLAGLERRAATPAVTSVNAEFADLPIPVMENVGAAALRMLREDPTLKTRALAMQAQAQATPRTKDLGTLFQPLFHGSPHNFDTFSSQYIGTGEGAQVYGHGLYFAENPNVAEGYRERLSGKATPKQLSYDSPNESNVLTGGVFEPGGLYQVLIAERDAGSKEAGRMVQGLTELHGRSFYQQAGPEGLAQLRGDLEKSIANMDREHAKGQSFSGDLARDKWDRDNYQAALEVLDKYGDALEIAPPEKPGTTYQVDIPDERIAHMLDWEKPYSQQPESVQRGVAKIFKEMGLLGDGQPFLDNRDPDGQLIHATIAASKGDKGASDALAAVGIPGLRYLDQASRGAGTGTRNVVVFDDSIITLTHKDGTPVTPTERKEFFQSQRAAPGRRASVSFDASGKATISLFDKADLTSLMHELGGHVFLELYGDVVDTLSALDPATLTPEQARILEDYRTVILPFLGVDSREAITRTQHEKWADAWEDYLMAGKAPSADLRSVFARMRAWFLHVYARLGRQVTLTDAVRGVMDRMLATDDAIAAAESEAQVQPLFVTAEDAGWSPAVFAAYQKDFQRAGEQARDRIQQATMQELTREREAVWQAERTQLRTEIAATVSERPIYRALTAIQKGTQPDGTPLPGGPMKLSKAALVAAKVSPETMKALRTRRLYSREGGLHPDVAAELFGYSSGDALVQTLSTTPPLAQTIDTETDAEMTARHGDRLLDGSIVAEARDAVMNVDGRAKVIAAEMRALAAKARAIGPALRAMKAEGQAQKRAGRAVLAQVPSRKAIQTFAEQRIAGTTIGQLRPLRYFAAARTAANLALERVTAQDYEGALAAKIQHLLNLELYRAAVDAQTEIEDARDRFGKMFRSDDEIGKTRNVDLVHAARAVASRYFFPTKADEVRTALDKVRTYDPDLYASLSDQIEAALSGGPDLKSLTVEGFVGMRDAVAALWAMARRTRQIVIDQQWVDRGVAEDALTARLDEVAPGTSPERTEGQMLLLGTRAALRRVESWADALDGGNPNGVFRRYIWTPISEATARYRVAKNASLKSFLDLVQPIEATLTRDKIAAPELNGHTFENLGGVLHALAHTGNASNLTKLIKGYGWGTVQADGTVDRSKWDAFVARLIQAGTLTKAHYDFVQAVWDLNETLKPAAQKAHHDLYGYYFAEVTAAPFDTPFGSYAGGYIPAMVDPLKSPDAAIRQEQTDVLAGDNSFMFPTTGRGFTKTRVEAYAKPLLLDLRTLPQHLDKVLRFIHLEGPVKDVARLVRDRSFRARLDAFDPTAVKDLLNPWLQRAATQRVSQPATSWGGKAADRFFRTVRTRTGLNIMAANVVNTLQQFTGLSIAAVKVKPRYLRNALWSYVRGPRDLAKRISDQSVFMATLLGTQGIEIQQTIDDILLTPSPFETVRTFATKHGYFLQGATQNVVNLITWSGAYEQAIATATAEAGQTEDQLHRSAVRQADSAVRLTQGTFAPEDVARFEAGTPLMRAFTMFSSYFNMLANLHGTEFSTIARELGLRKGAGRGLYVYAFGFMLPAVLSELIRQAIGGWDDDDDDTHLDEAMAIFFGSQFRQAAALVPYVGQVGLALANTFNDKPYDDRLTTSPAISTIENAVRAPAEVYKVITDGTGTKRAIQDTLSAVGLLTGFPVQPLGRPLGYLGAMEEGTEQPADAVDLARGLITGRSQTR